MPLVFRPQSLYFLITLLTHYPCLTLIHSLAIFLPLFPPSRSSGKTLDRVTTRELYAEYGLDANTQAFTGHAMALHRSVFVFSTESDPY
jgi:hypothetical protein